MDFESLDLILQNTNDIIIAVDLNYTIQKISNSAIILFNLDKNKIVGENLLEIFKKNQISLPFPKNLETTFKSKKSLETNGLMNTKFGNRLVNWKIIALEHSNKISTALIFGCDLPDDQNISHLNLKTYFDNILFHLPCYVYWKDVHSIYLGCNNLFAKAAGLTSAEKIVGKTDYDLAWGKTEADLFRQGDREVLEGHSKLNFEEPQYQADGTTKMVLASKIPMKDKSGNIIGILGIYTDISDRKLAEQREKKAIEETIEAKKQNEIMQNQVHLFKQLSGTVAHELFTPLRGVKAGFNFITKQVAKLTEAYQEGLSAGILKEKISEKAMRNLDKSLSNITKEIDYSFLFIEMLLANIRSEKFTGEPLKNCFIADAVDEALMRYPLNDTQKQKISTNLAYNFIYAGSQQLLIHVLFNLLKNALYYVAKARKGEITLWTVEKEKVNELHFKDTGEGISAEVLPHIFEQFFSKTLHGTGVGLTYCNMVMQSFGGSIDCQSIEGEYTEFILKFPKVTA